MVRERQDLAPGEARASAARAGALDRLRGLVRETLEGRDARVWLFGSRARGVARASSDVDLAVEVRTPDRRSVLRELRETLEESTIPLVVEVVDLREASPGLRREVEREGIRWI